MLKGHQQPPHQPGSPSSDPSNELTDPLHRYHIFAALLSFLFHIVGDISLLLLVLLVYFGIKYPVFGIGTCAAIALIWFFYNLFRDH